MAAETTWSIGIYGGTSPFALRSPENIRNPVLTARDVTDMTDWQPSLVADPFLVKEGSVWYMFFEVADASHKRAVIALATSADGCHFTYKQIVLREPFHLSYPYVFKWENEYYMIPESRHAYSVRLYCATKFPTKWSHVCDLLRGSFADSSVFHHDEKWWLFTSNRNEILPLYSAGALKGPWTEHPKSPLILDNAHIARCAGRVLQFHGRLIRFAQDCAPTYGNQIHAFEITRLSATEYEEKQVEEMSGLKASGVGWNAAGMHHVDAHEIETGKWIAAVDGLGDADWNPFHPEFPG